MHTCGNSSVIERFALFLTANVRGEGIIMITMKKGEFGPLRLAHKTLINLQ